MKAKDLKNSILQMAVEGKLVPQDPADEPASVLLERIREERRRLVAEKKIKAPKGGESIIYRTSDGSYYEKRGSGEPVCIDDEIPFEIPESWEWSRLGSLLQLISDGTHKTPDYKESGVKFLSVQNISSGVFDLTKTKYISKEDHEQLCKRVRPQNGDILICRIGTLGKPIIVDVDYEFSIFVSLGLLRVVDLCVNQWIVRCIDSPIGSDWIRDVKVGGGTHTFKINLGDIPTFLMPVPPLAEQSRILSQLANADLELKQYGALEEERDRLDVELPDRLRKSILQMAVQGKLVPHDPSDESASALLERIREERATLIMQKKIRSPKGGESVIYRGSDGGYYEKRIDAKGRESEPVCIDEEIPFEIPESWKWVRLGTLVTMVSGTSYKKHEVRQEGIRILRGGNLSENGIVRFFEDDVFVDDSHCDPEKTVKEGDIIVVGSTGSKKAIGRPGFVEKSLPNTQIGAFLRIIRPNHCPEWSKLIFMTEYYRKHIRENATGTNINNIKETHIVDFLVPFPPRAEQDRIANRIDELLALLTNQR